MSTATQRDTQRPTVAPSSLPTAPPERGDDEEVLLEGLRLGSQSYIPLDLAVPRRTEAAAAVDGLSHRARFLLLHVDGTSTLAQIARATSLPQSEVIGEFLELLGSGVVEVATPDDAPPPHRSGIFVHG